MDQRSTIIAVNSANYYGSRLLAVVLFLGIPGILILHTYQGIASAPGWACIFDVVIVVYSFLPRLFDRKPRLIVDERGIFDQTLGVGFIPWRDIRNAHAKTFFGKSFVCLDLRNTSHWLMQLTRTQRALANGNERLGFSPINLYLTGASVSAECALHTILARLTLISDPALGIAD
jgi:hypothetical protein